MMKRFIPYIIILILLAACSTTAKLPEGEQLYTGQKKMLLISEPTTSVGETALEEAQAALATAPNNSFFGSSTMRIPFPLGLWFYTGFVDSKSGVGKWLFNRFAANPITITAVNPAIRTQAAGNVLREYGYFNNRVSYKKLTEEKDTLRAKLQYTIDLGAPSFIDSIAYVGFTPRTVRFFEFARRQTLVKPGAQFSAVDLAEERNRLATLMRNMGCYYFRPDFMTYQADTTLLGDNRVAMRLLPVAGMPAVAEKPFKLGNTSFYLLGKNNERPNDSVRYEDLTIYYHDKLKVRPNMLYRWLNYRNFRKKRPMTDTIGAARREEWENLYSLYRQNRITERLANIGIFRYTEAQYTPRDTAYVSDTLDVNYIATLDKPYDVELDFNMKLKSNDQMGPGASFSITKKNIFGGGESLRFKLQGNYEWSIGSKSSNRLNSWEVGASGELIFPRVLLPKLSKMEFDFPASTTIKLDIGQINRAKYYKLLTFGGELSYSFQPNTVHSHLLTPFSLTFNVLRNPTEEFLAIQQQNPALYVSMSDLFIPAMEYTYRFDNAKVRGKRNPIWWETTVKSAGNITSVLYALGGKPFDEKGKKMIGVPFAQFLKLKSELRYYYRINRRNFIASRLAGGLVWSYGNATVAPYSEQFIVGGANSVRAFASQSIGPGSFHPNANEAYSYIRQVGDFWLEANLEYRFGLVNDLHGALFLDAGNVWLMKPDPSRPGGSLSAKRFLDEIALGTGVGLRYDMDILVFRLDLGIGLHAPYDTGKSGYYNIPKFKDGLALHFAIGYPF